MAPSPKLIDKLERRLPPDALAIFTATRAAAGAEGLRAYLVGGAVRDLLLESPSLDIDIVVEGDAIAVARIAAQVAGARLAKTTAFGTATVRAGDAVIDIATARAEVYAHPGALPRVTPSTIDDDLLRRDFTINAMALQLTEPAPGKLLDPTGGEADLRAKLVRVLHDRSFQDDATRILRAVRCEARFGFRLEERTLDLLARDIAYLDTISGTRIRQELARTFAEPSPEQAVARLRELAVFEAIHPSLSPGFDQASAFARLRDTAAPAVSAWPLLCWNVPEAKMGDLARRLALTRPQRTAVEAVPAARRAGQQLAGDVRPSEATRLLDELPLPTVHALAAVSRAAGALAYLAVWRTLRPSLRGDALLEMGVQPGPEVGRVLARLRAAKLDGEVKSRADEERLVEQFLARERIGLA